MQLPILFIIGFLICVMHIEFSTALPKATSGTITWKKGECTTIRQHGVLQGWDNEKCQENCCSTSNGHCNGSCDSVGFCVCQRHRRNGDGDT